jgi:hypothetical protein
MSDDILPFPLLADLHERHYGLTEAIARNYAEGAAVCMHRHHVSPRAVTIVADPESPRNYLAAWDAPTERQIAAWANHDDATRDGAYGMVIAATEAHFGYFVVGRARTGSGSDYLCSTQPHDSTDEQLDYQETELYRLEVSGIDRCVSDAQLDARLEIKVQQLRAGQSVLPGVAGVVAFHLARVKFAKL